MAESWGSGSPTACYFVYSYSESATHLNVTLYGFLYLAPPNSSSGGWPAYWSGYWGSGSSGINRDFNMNGAGASSQIAWGSYAIPRLYGQSQVAAFAISGTTYFGSASHQINFYPTPRQYSPPRPPLNPAAARVNDTQATVTWDANYDSSTGAQPWTTLNIDRWSASTGTWTRVASGLAWSTTSWSDTGITENNRYQWRIQAVNSGGTSTFAVTNAFATTPSAPTGVTAERIGSDIKVSWTNTANYQNGAVIYDNGTQVGEVTSGSTQEWTHPSPSTSVTHTYTVRAKTTTPSLLSAHSSPSNPVTLESPPNPPQNVAFALSPVGLAGTGTPAPQLTWLHNPTDSSQQRIYRLRWRKVGTSTWTNGSNVTSSEQSTPSGTGTGSIRNLIGGDWAVGQWEFQVLTYGSHANPSDWSASAFLTIENEPTVTITSPMSGATIGLSRITAAWTYSQAQSKAQAQTTLELLTGGNVVWSATRSSALTTFDIPFTLADDTTYQLSLTARSSTGIVSDVATVSFTVDYLEPGIPSITAAFNDMDGSIQMQIMNPSDPVATEFNRVYRCVDKRSAWMAVENSTLPEDYPPVIASEWELVGEYPTSGFVTDFECITYGRTVYRVEAVSAIPSSAVGIVVVDAASTMVWIGSGSQYRIVGAIPYNLIIDELDNLAFAEEYYFEGRDEAVLITGSATMRELSVSGTLDPLELRGATWDELRQIARTPGTKCYRDHDGRRVYCNLPDGVQTNREQRDLRHVTITVREVANE